MRSERYKNFILTVIAVLLALLVLRDAAPTTATAGAPVDVRIVGVKRGYDWDQVRVTEGR